MPTSRSRRETLRILSALGAPAALPKGVLAAFGGLQEDDARFRRTVMVAG